MAAHHGLYRLGQHLPGGVEVGGESLAVDLELVQAALKRVVAEHRMAERHSHVAQHRAVGEVALPAADRQLLRQMRQQRVGQAEVALGVLEVDRVHLVRHGRRTDFAFLEPLLEVTQAHIAPDVARPVDQDRVGARDRVEQLGHPVVRLDLDRVRIEAQAQRILDHAAAERLPVEIGPGSQVRVVVAHRAVHLGQRPHLGDARARMLQARRNVGDLLAERGRRRRLAMRAAEHRHVGQRMCHRRELDQQRVERRQQHRLARRRQHQRMAHVVDVLAGAREVHELGRSFQLGVAFEAALEPVLDRLDVVVGGALDVLDGLRLDVREAGNQRAQAFARRGRQRLEFGETRVGQRDEPLHLDLHAAVHQAELAEQRTQRCQLGGITSVERRQGGECGQDHRVAPARADPRPASCARF